MEKRRLVGADRWWQLVEQQWVAGRMAQQFVARCKHRHSLELSARSRIHRLGICIRRRGPRPSRPCGSQAVGRRRTSPVSSQPQHAYFSRLAAEAATHHVLAFWASSQPLQQPLRSSISTVGKVWAVCFVSPKRSMQSCRQPCAGTDCPTVSSPYNLGFGLFGETLATSPGGGACAVLKLWEWTFGPCGVLVVRSFRNLGSLLSCYGGLPLCIFEMSH